MDGDATGAFATGAEDTGGGGMFVEFGVVKGVPGRAVLFIPVWRDSDAVPEVSASATPVAGSSVALTPFSVRMAEALLWAAARSRVAF